MGRRTRILVFGDPGPARHVLLARKDVCLFWTETVESALATVSESRPESVVIRVGGSVGSAITLCRGVRARGGPRPIILADNHASSLRGEFTASGAACTLDTADAAGLLERIAEQTGLGFSKDPRVPYRMRVAVNIEGRDLLLFTRDVSVSGLAIEGVPSFEPGTRATLSFGARVLNAEIIRTWSKDGVEVAGLRFCGLSDTDRAWLEEIVAKNREVTSTLDLSFAASPGEPALVSEPEHEFRRLAREWQNALTKHLTGQATAPLPSWLSAILQDLTDIELHVARGGAAPTWAQQGLAMRVWIATARSALGVAPLPEALNVEARRFFATLRDAASNETSELIGSIGILRAAIVREVIAVPGRRASDGSHAQRSRVEPATG